ncbi:MAG: hypothetical protein ACREUT_02220 [Steroidobacteraceae bacterium]
MTNSQFAFREANSMNSPDAPTSSLETLQLYSPTFFRAAGSGEQWAGMREDSTNGKWYDADEADGEIKRLRAHEHVTATELRGCHDELRRLRAALGDARNMLGLNGPHVTRDNAVLSILNGALSDSLPVETSSNPGGTGLEQSPSDCGDGRGDSGLTPGGAGGRRTPGIPIDEGRLWSFLRDVLRQGGAIEADSVAGKYESYEHLSAHVDEAARKRVEEFAGRVMRQVETEGKP